MSEKVFISYAHEDRKHLKKVMKELERSGIEIDTTSIPETFIPGTNIRGQLRNAIESASRVVLLWTEAAAKSQYVNYEAGMAEALGKPIVVVVPETAAPELPPNLRNAQIMKLRSYGRREPMAKKRIFISYDYDNDKQYKNLLVAWDANKEFDIGFSDQSADVSIDSNEAAAIKRAISAKINDATVFLCLVGQHTHKSRWVAWEIGKAVDLKKKIVAVKIDPSNTTPAGLLNVGAKWAMSFLFDSIKKAVDSV